MIRFFCAFVQRAALPQFHFVFPLHTKPLVTARQQKPERHYTAPAFAARWGEMVREGLRPCYNSLPLVAITFLYQ